MASFTRLSGLVRDGEPVAAGVANRPTRRVDEKTNYLWEVLQAAGVGAALFRRRVAVTVATRIGQAVRYNAALDAYEPALASTAVTAAGLLEVAAESRVAGVVRYKHSAELADLTVAGFDTIDLTLAVGAAPVPGDYYLSPQIDGGLTANQPVVAVAVLSYLGNGQVFVWPGRADLADRHIHHVFVLEAAPAGTGVTTVDGHTAIDDADASLRGWLPADDPAFDGAAPAGAAFGYNLAADPALAALWPPLPESAAYLEWDQLGDGGLVGVPLPYFLVDRAGLWWMTDCVGVSPWPPDFGASADSESDSASASASASAGDDCLFPEAMTLRLWFSRPQMGTAAAVVTSLSTRDARILIRCANGLAGSSGDLTLALDLDFTVLDGGTGHLALLNFDADRQIFRRAPVATGLYTTGNNVALSGDATTRFTPGDATSPVVHHGHVNLHLDPNPTKQISPELYRLDGATTEFVDGVPYVGLPPDLDTSIRGRLRVPDDLPYAAPRLALRFRLLGSDVGDTPSIPVTARRIPAPGNGPATMPDESDEFAVTLDTAQTIAGDNDYYDVVATSFAVAAGDTVLFSLSRAGSTDGYGGTVGLLDAVGELSQ